MSDFYDLTSIEGMEGENSLERKNNLEKNMNKKYTKSVDIFSMGCVYYYVLSLGYHP